MSTPPVPSQPPAPAYRPSGVAGPAIMVTPRILHIGHVDYPLRHIVSLSRDMYPWDARLMAPRESSRLLWLTVLMACTLLGYFLHAATASFQPETAAFVLVVLVLLVTAWAFTNNRLNRLKMAHRPFVLSVRSAAQDVLLSAYHPAETDRIRNEIVASIANPPQEAHVIHTGDITMNNTNIGYNAGIVQSGSGRITRARTGG
ncbi:DUF6232 family protein [Streptomycetaceae bacterium NBC_01309]